MGERHFYRDLAPFHRFVEEAFEPTFYTPLPTDWLLVVADITASTRAVEAGRYAEVNYLGAACIVAVNNALGGLEIPTVFGGDGATLAVPPDARDAAVAALLATRRWGARAFGLDLRVGVVPVRELNDRGAVIEVAKMAFSPGNAMAMFRGDGCDVADALVKGDAGHDGFLVREHPDEPPAPDLENLSCRWAPLPSENGVMLCLIVAARAPDVAGADAVYRHVLATLDAIAEIGSARTSPVKLSNLRIRLRFSSMAKEVKGVSGPWQKRWPLIVLKHVLQALTFWFGLKPGGFDPALYKREITLNADFRKVSGTLKLIIDCSRAQADAIEDALARLHAEGRIDYGVHRASHAIMTCVTPNVDNHEHVHYIDGSEGGWWNAAKRLKRMIMRGHPS